MKTRIPESDIDVSIFEDMTEIQAYEYIGGKYSKNLTEEVRVYVQQLTKEWYEVSVHE